jgi:dTDP-4-amino-4,6-dideoxygalactose transaminase
VGGLEVGYVTDALRSGRHAGDGPFTAKVKAFIEQALPAEAVLLTTSCTSALELAALLLRPPGEVQPEVLLPTFTFVSTANAFLLHGWRPVFCDVDPTTGNVTPETLAARITPRTRAICPVHYAGVPADMQGIMALAAEHGLRVVEDAAQAFYAKDRGRAAGTIGDLGAFSFHETKNIGCGEGGALVVNAQDLHERARIVREKGTNRSQWLDGHVDKYTWMDVGSSFLSSDVLAAMLLAQLERYPELGAPRRHRVWSRYAERLAPLAERGRLRLPAPPARVEHNAHIFFVRVIGGLAERSALIKALNGQGIGAAFHYPALHTTPQGQRVHDGTPLPRACELSDSLVRLPVTPEMTDEDVDRVCSAVEAFLGG